MKRVMVILVIALLVGVPGISQTTDLSLVAYYPFNGNAKDSSGYGHDGVVVGATLTTDRFGDSGKAYHFTNGQYIFVHDYPMLRLSKQFTISAFVKVDLWDTGELSPGRRINYGQHAIVSKIDSGDWGGGYELRAVADTTFVVTGNVEPPNTTHMGSNVYYGVRVRHETAWNHVAFTFDGTLARMYLNGTLTRTDTIYGGFQVGSFNLKIGCRGVNWMWFAGSIDEVRLYKRTLSSLEISDLLKVPTLDTTTTSVGDDDDMKPLVLQNYPNPFNPRTTIAYTVHKTGLMRLSVVDILGRETVLVNEVQSVGNYKYVWNTLTSGVYFAVLESPEQKRVIRMVSIK